eukprot:TRINITY_DN1487_c0_g1_i1.p1 TRINITY_DN1487_c0_g1~~TRINITY_DN1487_c0_g1_i1.p1  ORF type:complete len:389 (+),score=97.48 TRINITY_DN1487_c0_g1_i1:214-1380(+)
MQSLRSSIRSGWRLLGSRRKGMGKHFPGQPASSSGDNCMQETRPPFLMTRERCTFLNPEGRVQASAQFWKPLLPSGCRCMSTGEGPNEGGSAVEGEAAEGSAEGDSKGPREKKKRLKKREKYGTYDKGFEYDLANLHAIEVSQPLYDARSIVDRWIEEQDDTPFKDLLTEDELKEAEERLRPYQVLFEGPQFDAMGAKFAEWQKEMLERYHESDFASVVLEFPKFQDRIIAEHGEEGREWAAEMGRQLGEYEKMLELQHGKEAMDRLGEELRAAKAQEEEESKGPRLRWESRVVLDPGGAWHPANRKVKMSVYVWELVRDVPLDEAQRSVLIDLVGQRYNTNKDELTITSERYRYREENRKDCLRTLYALLEEAQKPAMEVEPEASQA